MHLQLQREDLTADRTFGVLSIDGVPACFVLEDPVRPLGVKIAHETAIPAGRYPVTITKSRRFGVMLPLLEGVGGWSGVRLHAGNTTADTSGCLLLGLSRTDNTLVSSQLALAKVQGALAQALAHGEACWITIANPREEEPYVLVDASPLAVEQTDGVRVA